MHTYTPIFRITPLAGLPFTVSLVGYQWLRLCQPAYALLVLEKETVNRDIRSSRFGYRCTVTMEFVFPTPSANETTLSQQVVSAFANDDNVVELSLDNGTTYRVVHLVDFQQQVIDEKNIGLIERLVFSCAAHLDNKPAIGSGAW